MNVIAHRGASAGAPENTMNAFRGAWALGAAGVELDIRLTSDHHIVVFHDENGQRLAGKSRAIAACDLRELAEWRIAGESIPGLGEVLAEAPRETLTLIEIKSGRETLEPLKELLNKYHGKQTTLLAFDRTVAAAAAIEMPSIPVWLNVEAAETHYMRDIVHFVKDSGLGGVSLGWSPAMSPFVIELVHQAQLPIAVWTVNDPTEAIRAFKWGVDVLMTDRPGVMLPLVRHG
jgi:glycerophosphoryl diester phosphodiesterase